MSVREWLGNCYASQGNRRKSWWDFLRDDLSKNFVSSSWSLGLRRFTGVFWSLLGNLAVIFGYSTSVLYPVWLNWEGPMRID